MAISGRQLRFRRGFPVIHSGTARLPRRFAPRNDTSGECGGAPAPSSGLMTPYKALTNCRYTPYFGAYRLSAAGTGRQCLPEIATGAKRPRNDKPLAFTALSAACSDRQHCAGSGMPLPYNARPAAL